MKKFQKYISYGYLIAAILLLYEGIRQFSIDKEKMTYSLILAFLALFMFFFKRRLAKKYKK